MWLYFTILHNRYPLFAQLSSDWNFWWCLISKFCYYCYFFPVPQKTNSTNKFPILIPSKTVKCFDKQKTLVNLCTRNGAFMVYATRKTNVTFKNGNITVPMKKEVHTRTTVCICIMDDNWKNQWIKSNIVLFACKYEIT